MFAVVASISLSQLMLLSIYLGMTAGKRKRKLLFAAIAVLFLAIWLPLASEGASKSFGASYLQLVSSYTGILLALTFVAACARRFIGSIRFSPESSQLAANTRSQFSLLTLLVVLTTLAVLSGLARASRWTPELERGSIRVAEYLFVAVVFGLMVLSVVWASLGHDSTIGRLPVILFLSAMLGLFFLPQDVGVSPDAVYWEEVLSCCLLTFVSTSVVAVTLLPFRRLGFRLVHHGGDFAHQ